MSLRIKIKKTPQSGPSQAAEPTRHSKHSKRRIDSDDDSSGLRKDSADEEGTVQPRLKRARTHDSYGRASADEEVDVDAVGDVDIDDDEDDTRFLPPAPSAPTSPPPRAKSTKRASAHRSKASSSSRPLERRSKRAPIVWTDDEDEAPDYPERVPATDDSDEEFTPEISQPPPRKGAAAPKAKAGKSGVAAKGGRGKSKKEEKEILVRDERKLPPPVASTSKEGSAGPSTKRARPKGNDVDSPTPPPGASVADSKEPVEPTTREETPPLKKRKLPTIKKNKPATANSTALSTPTSAKPPTIVEKKTFIGTPTSLPLAVGSTSIPRKPAATVNNADFDLRDASVYAQLFTKPGGLTPNSGLNRKEKEEERKKELSRMREEARARRGEEAKQAFDLQAPQEKVQRFEEKLRERISMARYPNMLGAAYKSIYDRDRSKKEEGELR